MMKKVLLSVAIALVCIAVIVGGIIGYLYMTNKPSVTFDFAKKNGEITTGASGFLYGFAEPDIPSVEIAKSIGVSTLSTKTLGGLQHPIGDVNQVADTFINAGGKDIIVYTQDMYDTWYYEFDSMPEYLARVKETVTATEQQPYADRVVYCIYNEMDNGAWFGDFGEYENRKKTYDAWKETYLLVKSINPEARIGGPGYCQYNSDYIKEFLEFCKAENCLPDIMIWHELGASSLYHWDEHFSDYDAVCKAVGIEKLPVCITEYGLMETNGIPGESIKWISRIESTKAEACVAYWRLANNLSDVVADDVAPNSNWWTYRWYSQMTGETVESEAKDLFQSNLGDFLIRKSEGLKNRGFSGLATIDEDKKQIQILAGGTDRDAVITLNNLDKTTAFSGVTSVTVTAEYVDYKGLSGIVNTPKTKFVKNLPIENGTLEISLENLLYTQCLRFTISPQDESAELQDETVSMWRYEAEDADLFGTAYKTTDIAYAASQKEMVKADASEESGVEFTVDIPENGQYQLDLIYGNGANGMQYAEDGSVSDKGIRTNLEVEIAIDGTARTEKTVLVSTVKDDFTDCYTFTQEFTAGKHMVRIALPENASAGNTISFDFLDVTKIDSETNNTVYFEKDIKQSSDENTAFLVVAPTEGYYTVSVTGENVPSTVSLNDDNEAQLPVNTDGTTYSGTLYLPRGVSYLTFNAPALSAVSISKVEKNLVTEITPEQMTLSGAATLKACNAAISYDRVTASPSSCLTGISSAEASAAELKFNAPAAGLYQITFLYSNNEEGGVHDYNVDLVERYLTISVNGQKLGNTYFRSTYSEDTYKTKTILVFLKAGENSILLENDGSYKFNNKTTYAPDVGSVFVAPLDPQGT